MLGEVVGGDEGGPSAREHGVEQARDAGGHGAIHAEAAPDRAGAYPWVVLYTLPVINIFSFIDRQILALLVAPMKQDLGLTDLQVAWLYTGFLLLAFFVLIVREPARRAGRGGPGQAA